MNKLDYLQRLEEELIKNDYDERYINLCLSYSERLLDNNLPVIFDKEHFAKLIGLKKEYVFQILMVTEMFYKEISIPKKNWENIEIYRYPLKD